ncbi:type III secretion system export apparatus subunit SctU [Paucibacter sp. PLA-PC-4]|uniref:type III secretion system export apparatus subunit SctU n=1 Tax=Paucibacter sp. PLA-PC-4 TaxID=2993655 RepID=UPI00224B224C|nr:type III secretion system export apparatus subunit SctU [Paucibacter sp. PLA-PC-4]MCX2865581.1 type III secretion system export apparatus subunit SctU [Paucibacter sp. PLA-PC-4]
MSDDKTEEPTEHKLKQARDEGNVVKSQDIVAAVTALTAFGVLLIMADDAYGRLRRIVSLGIDFGGDDLDTAEMLRRMSTISVEAVYLIAPIVVAAAIAGLTGLAVQVGLKVTTKSVVPKLDAIDPAQGVKRIFSLKSLMSLGQSIVKAVLLGVLMWQAILALLPLISASAFQASATSGAIAWSAIERFCLTAIGVLAVLAPLDYAIQRHSFIKSQRMSKDEIKREFKSQEGDPQIKGQRRQLAQELAMEPIARSVSRADALIVNPTHYAVGVRYRADEAGVPIVLFKGIDHQALALRREAEALGVPVFSHPPLARALHKVPVNAPIPEELFDSVAVILRWVRELAQSRGSAAGQEGGMK